MAVAARDWETVKALEPVLASVEGGDPLYSAALRYRAEWRLVDGDDRDMAPEALEIVDLGLARTSPRWLLGQRKRALQIIRQEEEIPAELIEIPETE